MFLCPSTGTVRHQLLVVPRLAGGPVQEIWGFLPSSVTGARIEAGVWSGTSGPAVTHHAWTLGSPSGVYRRGALLGCPWWVHTRGSPVQGPASPAFGPGRMSPTRRFRKAASLALPVPWATHVGKSCWFRLLVTYHAALARLRLGPPILRHPPVPSPRVEAPHPLVGIPSPRRWMPGRKRTQLR